MLDNKPVQVPLAVHFKLSKFCCPKIDEEKHEMSLMPYANAIGCLMYGMVLTRPDISHAMSIVSGYMAVPGKEHYKGVKWIMRYISKAL